MLRAKILRAAAALAEPESSQEDGDGDNNEESLDGKQESAVTPGCTFARVGPVSEQRSAVVISQQQQGVERQQPQQQVNQEEEGIQQQHHGVEQHRQQKQPGESMQEQQQQQRASNCSRAVLAPVTNTLWSKPLTSMFNQKGPSAPKSIKDFFSPKGQQQQQQQQKGQHIEQQQQQLSNKTGWHCQQLASSSSRERQPQKRPLAEQMSVSGHGSSALPQVMHQGGRSDLLPV